MINPNNCSATINQVVEIFTPIKLEGLAKTGQAKLTCGKPQICQKQTCSNNNCEFVIKQTIEVEIPICYDVLVNVGSSYTNCLNKCYNQLRS